jgi:hypothetical protein
MAAARIDDAGHHVPRHAVASQPGCSDATIAGCPPARNAR